MTLVVDASVALKWFTKEAGSTAARRLIKHQLAAPDLLLAEVCNGAWKMHRLGRISDRQYKRVASRLPLYIDELAPLSGLLVTAAKIALDLDHPTYDCFYVALAESLDISYVTADTRFLEKVAGTLWAKRVVMLGAKVT